MACCDILEKARDAAKKNLSGKNLEVFLTEIGVSFHGCVYRLPSSLVIDNADVGIFSRLRLLLDHLRKFPVSATGGLMLAKYVDLIFSIHPPITHVRMTTYATLGISNLTKIRSPPSPSLHSTNASNSSASLATSSSSDPKSSNPTSQRTTSGALTRPSYVHTLLNDPTGVNLRRDSMAQRTSSHQTVLVILSMAQVEEAKVRVVVGLGARSRRRG